mgnify:CR=1 FL=1
MDEEERFLSDKLSKEKNYENQFNLTLKSINHKIDEYKKDTKYTEKLIQENLKQALIRLVIFMIIAQLAILFIAKKFGDMLADPIIYTTKVLTNFAKGDFSEEVEKKFAFLDTQSLNEKEKNQLDSLKETYNSIYKFRTVKVLELGLTANDNKDFTSSRDSEIFTTQSFGYYANKELRSGSYKNYKA